MFRLSQQSRLLLLLGRSLLNPTRCLGGSRQFCSKVTSIMHSLSREQVNALLSRIEKAKLPNPKVQREPLLKYFNKTDEISTVTGAGKPQLPRRGALLKHLGAVSKSGLKSLAGVDSKVDHSKEVLVVSDDIFPTTPSLNMNELIRDENDDDRGPRPPTAHMSEEAHRRCHEGDEDVRDARSPSPQPLIRRYHKRRPCSRPSRPLGVDAILVDAAGRETVILESLEMYPETTSSLDRKELHLDMNLLLIYHAKQGNMDRVMSLLEKCGRFEIEIRRSAFRILSESLAFEKLQSQLEMVQGYKEDKITFVNMVLELGLKSGPGFSLTEMLRPFVDGYLVPNGYTYRLLLSRSTSLNEVDLIWNIYEDNMNANPKARVFAWKLAREFSSDPNLRERVIQECQQRLATSPGRATTTHHDIRGRAGDPDSANLARGILRELYGFRHASAGISSEFIKAYLSCHSDEEKRARTQGPLDGEHELSDDDKADLCIARSFRVVLWNEFCRVPLDFDGVDYLLYYCARLGREDDALRAWRVLKSHWLRSPSYKSIRELLSCVAVHDHYDIDAIYNELIEGRQYKASEHARTTIKMNWYLLKAHALRGGKESGRRVWELGLSILGGSEEGLLSRPQSYEVICILLDFKSHLRNMHVDDNDDDKNEDEAHHEDDSFSFSSLAWTKIRYRDLVSNFFRAYFGKKRTPYEVVDLFLQSLTHVSFHESWTDGEQCRELIQDTKKRISQWLGRHGDGEEEEKHQRMTIERVEKRLLELVAILRARAKRSKRE